MAYVKEDWWHEVPEAGNKKRRIGWLWPEDFVATLSSRFGRGWVEKAEEEFGLSRAQIDRYQHGEAPIPKVVAMAVVMMDALKGAKKPVPRLEAPWLPLGEGANARHAPKKYVKRADARSQPADEET